MGIGPVFECPESLVERLPAICRDLRLSVEILGTGGRDVGRGYMNYCVFGSWLGRIDGRLSVCDKVHRIWLIFPKSHVLNPLLWPVSFRLVRRIEALLVDHGALRCDWEEGMPVEDVLKESETPGHRPLGVSTSACPA